MKKKILIISSSLSTGGLEKCLLNLCDNLDYDKYEVDLYLFNEGRALIEKLNKNVNLLPDSPYYATVFNRSLLESVRTLLKNGKIGLALYKFIRFLKARLGKTASTPYDWKNMKKTMLEIDKYYDVAIGFEEGSACYYAAECVNADKKIGWIHTDIKKIDSSKKLDERAFSLLDHVVTVSENSLNSLNDVYPDYKDKFRVIKIPALINTEEVDKLSLEPNVMDDSVIKILSVGRLVELKGFHLCVEPCKRLVDEGYNVKWYVAGDGDYRSVIETEVEKHGVSDSFILLGNQSNPYTYFSSADIVVQPSSYEGLSVTVIEAKHFKKPIVVTGIPSNRELINDTVNGLIIERDSESIYRAVKYLLDNKEKRLEMASSSGMGGISNAEILAEIESLFE